MNYRKKVISLLVLNALFFGLLPIGVKAQSATFGQTIYNLEPETEFTISINVQNMDFADSVDLVIEYNPNIIEILDVVGGEFSNPEEFFGIFWMPLPVGENEQVMMSVPCDFICVGDGELVSVVFKTKTNTGSTNIDMIDMTYYKNLFEEYPGNTGDSVVVNVSVPDTMNPQIEINTPSVDSTYDYSSVNNTLTIGGTASDNVTVASVSYTVNNGSSILANGTDVWSAEIALAPGENTITVTATDTSGLTASDTITVNYTVVVLDTENPQIEINTPSVDSTYDYSSVNNTLTIGGTASDNVTVASVSYAVNNGNSILANGTDVWSAEIALAPGENTITVTATDSSGLTASDTITVNYTVVVLDTTAPVRSAGSPSGALDSPSGEITLVVTTDENATCHYSANALTVYGQGTIFANTGTTSHSTVLSGLNTGASYSYYIKCADESLNINDDDYQISFSINSVSGNSGSSGGGGASSGGGTSSGGGASPVGPTTAIKPALTVTNFLAAKSGKEIFLSWENPVDSEFRKVIVLKSFTPISQATALEEVLEDNDLVYQGTADAYIDYNDSLEKDLYYYLYVSEVSGRISQSALAVVRADAPTTQTNEVGGNELQLTQIESLSQNEATYIMSTRENVEMKNSSRLIYEKITKNRTIGTAEKYSLAQFIENGTESTKLLGAGERGGVVDSYYKAFGKLPITKADWMDVIKIANGRWPNERNTNLEKVNIDEVFAKIYKRKANMSNPNDNAAITIITYGLRPADRNLNSEAMAINHFRGIFGHQPETAQNWDIVRAIAYSGATR
jgi:uncharacterized membrane protein YgcG